MNLSDISLYLHYSMLPIIQQFKKIPVLLQIIKD
jgi:hypothetical protein